MIRSTAMFKKIKETLNRFTNYMNDVLRLVYKTNPTAILPAGAHYARYM